MVLILNPGNHNEGETPVPIPNTEVKPLCADGTARGAEWESRSLPGFFFFSEIPDLSLQRPAGGNFKFMERIKARGARAQIEEIVGHTPLLYFDHIL